MRHIGSNADYARFHGHEQPFPEFPAFTHVNEAVCRPTHILAAHRHPQLEICYFHAGRAEWTCGGERVALGPGDCFVTRPGEVHSGRPDPADPNHNFAVGFDPAALGPAMAPRALASPERDLGLAMVEAEAAGSALPAVRRVVHGAQGAEGICRRLLAECDGAPPEGPGRSLALAMCQALLVELFVHVTRCALAAGGAPAQVRPEIASVLAWLPGRLDDPPDLAAMAARAGLSPMHFASEFRKATGRTPLEHLTRLRLEAAARRLAGDARASVTDVALDFGFCSSQYFSVVFRRHLGCTPSEWRSGVRPAV